jgi:hypothetical protein
MTSIGLRLIIRKAEFGNARGSSAVAPTRTYYARTYTVPTRPVLAATVNAMDRSALRTQNRIIRAASWEMIDTSTLRAESAIRRARGRGLRQSGNSG